MSDPSCIKLGSTYRSYSTSFLLFFINLWDPLSKPFFIPSLNNLRTLLWNPIFFLSNLTIYGRTLFMAKGLHFATFSLLIFLSIFYMINLWAHYGSQLILDSAFNFEIDTKFVPKHINNQIWVLNLDQLIGSFYLFFPLNLWFFKFNFYCIFVMNFMIMFIYNSFNIYKYIYLKR